MGILTPGWVKKTLHLKTIVSCAPIKDLPPDELERFDAMRAFNRRTIGELDLMRRIESLPPQQHADLLHEPAEIYGWQIRASLYGRSGTPWWLVGVARKAPPTDKDKLMLAKIMNLLGCDDLKRDQLSVCELDDVIAAGIPYLYTWENRGELLEVQVNKALRGKDVMRIVPRGTRPSDGYERMPDHLAGE